MPRTTGRGRLIAAAAWLLLLLALWAWAYTLTDGASSPDGAAGEDTPFARLAAERPPMPPAHDPLEGAPQPRRLDLPALGLHAPVVERGGGRASEAAQHADGAPPPDPRMGPVRWDARGPVPGAGGAARLWIRTAGYGDGSPERGSRLYVGRADGSVAEFTVSGARAARWSGATEAGGSAEEGAGGGVGRKQQTQPTRQQQGQQPRSAQLRLSICRLTPEEVPGEGSGGKPRCAARTVVSAYLTGSRPG